MKHKPGDTIYLNGYRFKIEMARDKDNQNTCWGQNEYFISLAGESVYKFWIPAKIIDENISSEEADIRMLCKALNIEYSGLKQFQLLQDCPSCWSQDISIYSKNDENENVRQRIIQYTATCVDCGEEGKPALTIEEAIQFWNELKENEVRK